MSDAQIKFALGVFVFNTILILLYMALTSKKETKKEKENIKIEPVKEQIKVELPKHKLIYEYNEDLKEYYILTDFSLGFDRYDEFSIPEINRIDGVLSTQYIDRYSGKFKVGKLFNSEDVFERVVDSFKRRRIDIEVINNIVNNN